MSSVSAESSSKPALVCCAEQACDDLNFKHSRAWLRISIAGVFAGQDGLFFGLE